MRKTQPTPPKRDYEDGRNQDNPMDYRGPLRTLAGERGAWQRGSCFTQGQATEIYCPPQDYRRWHWGNIWHLSIGCLALNNGAWLAWDALPLARKPDTPRGALMPSGGFHTYSRQFPSRDAAIRANAAYVIRQLRREARWKPGKQPWEKIPTFSRMPHAETDRLIAWAFGIAGRPWRRLYRAPPPLPPAPKKVRATPWTKPDKSRRKAAPAPIAPTDLVVPAV